MPLNNKQSTSAARQAFREDFRQAVDTVLTAWGAPASPDEPDDRVIYRYYAMLRRQVPVQPYAVYEPSVFTCPADVKAGYDQLIAELKGGADVSARLSRTMAKPDYEDGMLNDWGIFHFHLGERDVNGDVPRTGPLAYTFIRETDVHVIGVLPHKQWAYQELLEVLHRNWSQAIAHARLKGVVGLAGVPRTDRARQTLRNHGIQTFTQIDDAVYGPLGGGLSSAGTSVQAQMQTNRTLKRLDELEAYVSTNAATIATAIRDLCPAATLGKPPAFRFAIYQDGTMLAVETTANVAFALGPCDL